MTVKAGALNFDQLMAFAHDFSTGSGMASASSAPNGQAPPASAHPAGVPPMNITISLQADRATMGALALEKLAGTARITPDAMTLNPVSFGVFGGKYDGSLVFSLGAAPDFKLDAAVSGIDMAAATAFAGSPNTITGRMSGKMSLTGRGVDQAAAMKTARGTARVDVVNGVVKRLGLVHTVVVATSGRGEAVGGASGGASDEPFTKLGATLTIADGSARTDDLHFESKDILFSGSGTLRLDGTAMNLQAQVQLSDELSRQAGRDLVRYTQEGGRVTVPATIAGSSTSPQVRVDVTSMARRAITNRANEEAQKAVKKGLGSIFKK
jgi:uncharacterized protein involved in outer membrane biogenesis